MDSQENLKHYSYACMHRMAFVSKEELHKANLKYIMHPNSTTKSQLLSAEKELNFWVDALKHYFPDTISIDELFEKIDMQPAAVLKNKNWFCGNSI